MTPFDYRRHRGLSGKRKHEIKKLPVISKELYPDLLKFLGFRHVVRQAYGFQLDVKKLDELEKLFLNTWKRFSREIKKFFAFLEGKSR